ncbi:MAG: cytochrome c1 [Gammaproteobacteria bacterium]|nr:cytochrome c1 [Gammaproteobacteria bacterium]
MRAVVAILFFVVAPSAWTAALEDAQLDKVYVNLSDRGSLQRGARLFVNYCLSCHSAAYMRYNRLSTDLGISEDVVEESLLFAGEKMGDLMITTMPKDAAKKWFGIVPPDLTVIARAHKPDWIYTYLRSFYLDESTPSGWNNTLFPNVAMPHVLFELQGVQLPKKHTEGGSSEEGHEQTSVSDQFELVKAGTLTPAEFDVAVRDLVNYMVYMAEPAKLVRYNIGVFVILFLIVLTVLFYFLKKEYWKDVH